MSDLVIKGGRVLDATGERDADVLVRGGHVVAIGVGLTADRAARLKPDTVVMHPGPMNRGVEIAAEVADGPASIITDQVANGVAVRMAVLWSLLGSGGPVA